MKSIFFALKKGGPLFLSLLIATSGLATLFAGELRFSYDARTGDKELDASLGDFNIEARGDMNNFVNSVSVTYDAPVAEIQALIDDAMEPADIFMSYLVADISNKEVDEVVDEFHKNRDKGWGVIARNLGIKPGSKEFHALKKGDFDMLKSDSSESKGKGKGKGRGSK